MKLSNWGLGLVAAAIVFATAAIAGDGTTTVASAAPMTRQSMRAYCNDLVTQFNAVDTKSVAPASLADAKDHASRGEMLCGTMPKTGVKEMWVALKTVGVEPK